MWLCSRDWGLGFVWMGLPSALPPAIAARGNAGRCLSFPTLNAMFPPFNNNNNKKDGGAI